MLNMNDFSSFAEVLSDNELDECSSVLLRMKRARIEAYIKDGKYPEFSDEEILLIRHRKDAEAVASYSRRLNLDLQVGYMKVQNSKLTLALQPHGYPMPVYKKG